MDLMKKKLVHDSITNSRYGQFAICNVLFGNEYNDPDLIKRFANLRRQDVEEYPHGFPTRPQFKYPLVGVVGMLGSVICILAPGLTAYGVAGFTASTLGATIPFNPFYIKHKSNAANRILQYVESRKN